MARAKKCVDEFNPWPPFVDVFSSVILVLLLFILVTIVNVAYYMQFNAKTNSEATTKSQTDSLQAGSDITDMIALAKQEKPKSDAGNDSLFTGGKSEGNAISSSDKEEKVQDQSLSKGKGELLVAYNDKEIFNTAKIKTDIKAYIKDQKKKNPNAKFEISVAQPTAILGTTIPKQISLGRALNVKNLLKNQDIKLSNITLKMQKNRDQEYSFGYVKIKVIK